MSAKSNSSENYYSVLNCSSTASYEQLKQSYQELIRKYHPDKSGGSQKDFLSVDKAWKTLRDEQLRSQYDIHLQTESEFDNIMVYAQLAKSDLKFDSEETATYPCRCGSNFLIHKDYFGEDDCVVECNECSNYIQITN